MTAFTSRQAAGTGMRTSLRPAPVLAHKPSRPVAVTAQAASQSEAAPELSRRAILLSAGGAPLLAAAAPLLAQFLQVGPARAAENNSTPTSTDWEAVKADILELIKDPSKPGGIGEKAPTLVRLAWHSSGTYDKMTRTGGSGMGTIRFTEELAHAGNAGLKDPVSWLEPIHSKHPAVSYADLFTYAGVVAIEAMGGPKIPFRAGRVDTLDPSFVTPDDRLPSADEGSPPKTAAALRRVFNRMGFDDREIVALSGAHALGRCHANYSGYVGPWTPTPEFFSNLYFKLLLKVDWTPDDRYSNFQYKDSTGTLMMLPSDLVLIQDEEFKKYVELYAKEKKTFFKDFAAAFNKLEELGTSNLVAIA